MPSFGTMFGRLRRPEGQSRTARTVEIFGWILLVESTAIFLAPRLVAVLLSLPTLERSAENYFRLVGLLVGGLGMLYVVSGRLNSEGFAFASLFDRPLVPLVMAVLWARDIVPGPLALAFSVQDFGSFLWTVLTWRSELSGPPAVMPKL